MKPVKDDRQVSAAVDLFRSRLRAYAKEQHGNSLKELGKDLGIPNSTLEAYLYVGSLPKPDLLARIAKKIGLSDLEQKQIARAFSRRASLARSGPRKKTDRQDEGTPSDVCTPTADASHQDQRRELPPVAQAILERLEHVLQQVPAAGGTDDRKLSTAYSRILAGERLGKHTVGQMPYILSKKSFEGINVARWTPAQRAHFAEYTRHVLTVARKCLLILAQMQPLELQRGVLESLQRDLRLLWNTYKVAGSAFPQDMVELLKMEESIGSPSTRQKVKGAHS